MSDEDQRKLIVREEGGDTLLETVITEKGYRKSLETGELWTLHPETGRLLPLGGGVAFLSLSENGDSLEAVITSQAASNLVAAGLTQAAREARITEVPEVLRNQQEREAGVDTPADGERASGSKSATEATGQTAASVFAELAILEKTVASRKSGAESDGSYTAYLFSQGEQKIRKKLGEEAIELCLASENERIVSESADLLYHLSVLLVSRGLSYEQVLSELQRRREA